MQHPKRIELVKVDRSKIPFSCKEEDALLCPDVLAALYDLKKEIEKNKGTLKINSFFRTWAKQQSLVDLHNKDVEANKKDPSKPITHAYAAPPGNSFHMAGRAIDVDLHSLNFQGEAKTDWLKKLWDLAIPLGFNAIISKPDMNISEAWHFDHRGAWKIVCDKIGTKEAVKCSILDVGNWDPNEDIEKVKNRFIQAELIKLGRYELAKPDGIIGNMTKKALKDIVNVDVLNTGQLVEILKNI
ncbi:MAG: M15 family metallopeptidase [Nanoarchaeota archaeon]